ncbi:IS1096 element passenger TnpR family protein [Paraburkholderia silvatlantica]|uniref:IS1096 element passenger TnpR family protein n=1 Tax=Paraburkholderia silvatlantica TaxID=321895 RepID=UPI0031453B44
MPDYLLRVELEYFRPVIWRRIIVPGSTRLSKLHVVLLLATGREGGPCTNSSSAHATTANLTTSGSRATRRRSMKPGSQWPKRWAH